MIDVTCPQCGAVYHSEETHFGKHLRCARCGSLVPILRADRTVVKQSPASPDAPRSRANTPSTTRPTHRIQRVILFAATSVVIGVTAIFLMLPRHPAVAGKGTASLPDIAVPAQPPKNNDNTPKFEVVDAEPITSLPPQIATDAHGLLPPADARPIHYNSLPSATVIHSDLVTNGNGELTVENGTSEDAVVLLSDVANRALWFFVKARSSADVAKIPEGSYTLGFTTGLNWVESEDTFRWHPSYSEFERLFLYSEQRDSKGIQYKSISVTLNPVPLGNIRKKAITREEFLRGHHHLGLQQP